MPQLASVVIAHWRIAIPYHIPNCCLSIAGTLYDTILKYRILARPIRAFENDSRHAYAVSFSA